jgi:MFS superfamily sulfate permease-like transporter
MRNNNNRGCGSCLPYILIIFFLGLISLFGGIACGIIILIVFGIIKLLKSISNDEKNYW